MGKRLGKIFVVDDDEAIVEVLTYFLEDEGYEVKSVRHAEKIISHVLGFSPHLILLDLFLSEDDGREIAKALKQTTETSTIPIIMFSAHPSGRQEAEKLGVAGYLAKPFDMDELFTMIQRHALTVQ